MNLLTEVVPPSGGSLEIGNHVIPFWATVVDDPGTFPLRGDP